MHLVSRKHYVNSAKIIKANFKNKENEKKFLATPTPTPTPHSTPQFSHGGLAGGGLPSERSLFEGGLQGRF